MNSLFVKRYLFLIVAALPLMVAAQQSNRKDSLEKVLSKETDLKERVKALCLLSYEFILTGEDQRSLDTAKAALKISEDLDFKEGMFDARVSMGDYYDAVGNYPTAISYYETALRLARAQKDQEGIAKALNNMGGTYREMGNYKQALENFLETQKLVEATGNRNAQASVYNNLGIVYYYLKDLNKSLEAFKTGIRIRKEQGDRRGMAATYGNIANIYTEMSMPDTALDYLVKARKVYEELGAKRNIAFSENAMGLIYMGKKNFTEALKHYNLALEMKQGFSDKQSDAITLSNIGSALDGLGKYEEGEKKYMEALAIFRETNATGYIKDAYWSISHHFQEKKDYKSAFEYMKSYTLLNDSIFSKESAEQLGKMQARYETERKESAIQLLTKEKEVNDLALTKQTQQKNFLIAGVILVLLLAGLLFSRYQLKNRSHKLLEDQNRIIAQKNKDITDSINYAKRIQDSMLPSLKAMQQALPGLFVLFKPKDIVSGDFYWYAENKGKVYIAAADCTGHGVPGAFMSMIGNDKLNHAVVEKQLSEPSEILFSLNHTVKEVLQQNQGETSANDGMDIALCAIDLKSKQLNFAGANRPLYIIRRGEIIELKPTKAAVGGHTSATQEFEEKSFVFETGDSIYLFSDGYADQFGGQGGKKLMTGKFKEILISLASRSPFEQQAALEDQFIEWKGELEQVDDVLVIGIKI